MRKLSDKKVVFFDMGNTLLYFHEFKNKEKQAEEIGIEYLYQFLVSEYPSMTKDELIQGFIGPWHKCLLERKETLVEKPIDELLNAFLKNYDGYMSYPMCVNAFRMYYEPFMDLIEIKKDTYDVIKTLKDFGYTVAVLSNTPYFSEVMRECFEMYGLEECVDYYFFSYDIGTMKPKKELFEYALTRLGVEAKECFMVGDSLIQDMAPAARLGMDCIWLNHKNEDNYLEVNLFKECHELSEILSWLLEVEKGDSILLPEEVVEDDEEEYQLDASSFLDEEDDFDPSLYLDED